jgi:DNA-binding NtrC family response regulator
VLFERLPRAEQPQAKKLDETVFPMLESYGWPGNARELRNAIERMAILTAGERLTRDAIPAEIRVQPETDQNRPFRKRAIRPNASTSSERWRNPVGRFPAPRRRWGWSEPICISGFGR